MDRMFFNIKTSHTVHGLIDLLLWVLVSIFFGLGYSSMADSTNPTVCSDLTMFSIYSKSSPLSLVLLLGFYGALVTAIVRLFIYTTTMFRRRGADTEVTLSPIEVTFWRVTQVGEVAAATAAGLWFALGSKTGGAWFFSIMNGGAIGGTTGVVINAAPLSTCEPSYGYGFLGFLLVFIALALEIIFEFIYYLQSRKEQRANFVEVYLEWNHVSGAVPHKFWKQGNTWWVAMWFGLGMAILLLSVLNFRSYAVPTFSDNFSNATAVDAVVPWGNVLVFQGVSKDYDNTNGWLGSWSMRIHTAVFIVSICALLCQMICIGCFMTRHATTAAVFSGIGGLAVVSVYIFLVASNYYIFTPSLHPVLAANIAAVNSLGLFPASSTISLDPLWNTNLTILAAIWLALTLWNNKAVDEVLKDPNSTQVPFLQLPQSDQQAPYSNDMATGTSTAVAQYINTQSTQSRINAAYPAPGLART